MQIKCRAVKKLYPPEKADEVGFMIVSYVATGPGLPPTATSNQFSAKGVMLPTCSSTEITLIGDVWEENNGKLTLSVTDYEELIPPGRAVALEFLKTLNGCEEAEAQRICNLNEPNIISALRGNIGLIDKAVKNKALAETIGRSFRLRTTQKAILFYLMSFDIKRVELNSIVEAALMAESIEEVKADPFRFAIEGVLPYSFCRKIAEANEINATSERGIQAAVIDVILKREGSANDYNHDATGNTYTELPELCEKAGAALGISKDSPEIRSAIQQLLNKSVLACAQGKYIYRWCTGMAEYGIADEIVRLLSADIEKRNNQQDIFAIEDKKKMRLALEQNDAVKLALNNAVSLLIGGPGTGKTSIEQYIIEIYRKYNRKPILLVAPTGKAARRMSESTGEPASTVHKALGVSAGAEVIVSDVILDAGLILCDEASMLDSQVCFALLKAIKTGTQLVIVGDTNQLPSVGAGNVLFELIKSGAIPVAALELVHRQAAGSTIALNCAKIKRGVTTLEYSPTFTWITATSQEDAAKRTLEAYKEELDAGLTKDDIFLLSPYRKNTPTGVNQLNTEVQKLFQEGNGHFIQYGNKKFFVGDKVILMQNQEDVANGDIGYVTHIDEKSMTVDFEGRVVSYKKSELKTIDLAYAMTIHKSQGTEAKTAIILLMDEHQKMLRRNLIYTAVSRAKTKVILIGTETALKTAINTEDVTKRQSRLGDIINYKISAQCKSP